MTPKEKAEDITNQYLKLLAGGMYDVREEAKKCALMTINEIILSCLETTKLYEAHDMINSDISCQPIGYYKEVRYELEKQ